MEIHPGPRKNVPQAELCPRWRVSDVEGRLDVGGAVAIEAGGGDGLGEDDADRNEDGAGPGGEGHGDFDAGTFGILIAATEAEAALGQILTDGDLLLKAAAANASEDAGLDASAVAARDDAGARAFPSVSFEVAAQVELLSHREFLVQAEDTPIAADEQGFRGLCKGGAGGRDPRGLHGHAEVDAVTLPESIG